MPICKNASARRPAWVAAGAMLSFCVTPQIGHAAQPDLASLDTDKDGSLDLAEAKTAAGVLFSFLDRDKNGSLDARELTGYLDQKTFAAADHDLKGSLDQEEYFAVVEARFKAANKDEGATLDAAELNTPAGERLLILIRNPGT
jgi:hypothetical protein